MISDQKIDQRKTVCELVNALRLHPLWHIVPVAIATNRIDFFSEKNVKNFQVKHEQYFNTYVWKFLVITVKHC